MIPSVMDNRFSLKERIKRQQEFTQTYSLAANGCDSTVYTTLTVLEPVAISNAVTICTGASYTVGTSTYTSAGQYVDVFTAANGCDSVVTTNLFVESQISTNITETICTGTTYLFDGANLNVSGTYVDTLVASAGCDSIVTLYLTCYAIDYEFNHTNNL